jgi:hypothetical protein
VCDECFNISEATTNCYYDELVGYDEEIIEEEVMNNITNVKVYGLDESMVASGYPMMIDASEKQDYKRMEKRMTKLGNAKGGSGHDSALKGIVVQFDWRTPVLMQPQIQRYHFIDIVSSQSAMHRILSKKLTPEDFAGDVEPTMIDLLNSWIEEKDFYKVIYNLPQSYMKTARYTTNYLQLKTMYNQRKNHKLREWKEFCDWCEMLPKFKEFCLGGA